MTDIEIIRACAKAMGLDYDYNDTEACAYAPLTDDAQMVALVKQFDLSLAKTLDGKWLVQNYPATERSPLREYPHGVFIANDADLNRAVCTCIAQMWLAKKGSV